MCVEGTKQRKLIGKYIAGEIQIECLFLKTN